MLLVGRFGNIRQKKPREFILVYSVSVNNSNLFTDLVNAGWTDGKPRTFLITVNGGVQLGSTSTGTPGLTIPDSFPDKTTITITNNGTINGKGGAGGAGGAPTGGPGGTGGKALLVDTGILTTVDELNIINNGEINGGGGGGGGGGRSRAVVSIGGKGGFCAGCCSANGGTGGTGYGNAAQTGGSGGASCGQAFCVGGIKSGGTGGTGGGKGAGGNSGNSGVNSGGCTGAGGGGSGGAAGAAVDGNSVITWQLVGTINGSLIN